MAHDSDFVSRSSSEPESLPFLQDLKTAELPEPSKRSETRRSHVKAILIHTILIAAYTVVSILFVTREKAKCYTSSHLPPWSPAEDVVSFEERRLEGFVEKSKFAGPPSPEIDAEWRELMRGVNIKILPEEMERIGLDSVALKDGSGYAGALSVYHELHCVKVLRHWLYKEHYFGELDEHDLHKKRSHVEHCIEELRVAVACHGDTTVIPYYWLHNTDEEQTLLGLSFLDHEPVHQCVKWDPLHNWAKSRRLDIRDLDAFVPEDEM